MTLSLFLIALAMSTDAFAVALARGTASPHVSLSIALRTGLFFGVVEGLTPVLGWLLGWLALPWIQAWDHWLAFALLVGLGLKMLYEGCQPAAPVEAQSPAFWSWGLLLTALATSMDALAVGISFALMEVPIALAALLIGLATTLMVSLGMLLGQHLGGWLGKKAECLGGLILLGIGGWILYEHLFGAAATLAR